MKYYIKGNYYFDFDRFNQIRLTGPQNHLLMGLTFPAKTRIKLIFYELHGNKIIIKIRISKKILKTAIPAVTDIRTIRSYASGYKMQKSTFPSLVLNGINEVIPKRVKKFKKRNTTVLEFSSGYKDEFEKSRKYGIRMVFPSDYKVNVNENLIRIKSDNYIEITFESVSNIPIVHRIKKVTFSESGILSSKLLSSFQKKLYKNSFDVISHLLKAQKTSSYEFGTIYPRDWIESADLGDGDFSKRTIDYMYTQAMKHTSDEGEAWHEDIVGAYRERVKGKVGFIDRKMIDIEPHYIMGINYVSKKNASE